MSETQQGQRLQVHIVLQKTCRVSLLVGPESKHWPIIQEYTFQVAVHVVAVHVRIWCNHHTFAVLSCKTEDGVPRVL